MEAGEFGFWSVADDQQVQQRVWRVGERRERLDEFRQGNDAVRTDGQLGAG
jgi:hypothetical protein